jgi:pimeloyl-ACP methyl ester carboxylesterase
MTFLAVLQRSFAILSLIILAASAYLLWTWWDMRDFAVAETPWIDPGGENWRLYLGGALLLWSFLGAVPVRFFLGRGGGDGRRMRRTPGEHLVAPDGSRLHVERDGPVDAPVLVFTHGWGMDATLWADARRQLADRYHLILWDLPGLGRSSGPKDGRYSLDRFADALGAVVDLAGRRQAILVGHSIGGMIIQTLARRQPHRMGRQIAGVVLENTTHTDPLNTTFMSQILRPMQPLFVPMMHLDVWLQPIVWAMNWQSYLSGSTHIAMRLAGFGTQPTRELLEQASLLATRNSPAVQAKGNLAMMRWDATKDLSKINAPTMVFVGGRDLVTRPDAGETIARLAPQAVLRRVDPAGHMGPQECAETYNSAISAFADSVFTRRALAADADVRSQPVHAHPEASPRLGRRSNQVEPPRSPPQNH